MLAYADVCACVALLLLLLLLLPLQHADVCMHALPAC
jgi:hypothetical protein